MRSSRRGRTVGRARGCVYIAGRLARRALIRRDKPPPFLGIIIMAEMQSTGAGKLSYNLPYARYTTEFLCCSAVLDEKSLWDLVNELYDKRTKWKRIGLGLSVPKSDLEAMSGNNYDCLETMLSTWLKGINPPPTWERLVVVLQSTVVDEKKKAAEIEEKFCNVVTPTAVPGSYASTYSMIL